MRLCLAVALILAACTASGAEVTLRNDLRPRLEQLRPIYGEETNAGMRAPIIAAEGAEDGNYFDGLRVISVTGAIKEGDAARLAEIIGTRDEADHFVVVLDSPGGNFLEGVRMGEVLRDFRGGNATPYLHGVVVLAEDECLSACAVAFALAAYPRDSGKSVRYVELGARLGFHMPFVPVEQQAAQTEIARAMDLTYEIMSEYIRLISNGIAPSALVQNALHYRRPEEFFMLRGGLVTRFMDFVPVAGPRGTTPLVISGLTQRDALNMCQYLTYSQGRDMIAAEYEFWPVDIGRFPEDLPLVTMFERLDSRRLANDGCSIEWRQDDTLGIAAFGDCGRPATGGGWCAAPRGQYGYTDLPLGLPSATGALLADSLGCHGGRLTRRYYRWDDGNAFLEEEEPEAYRWVSPDPESPVQTLDWSGARLTSNLNIRAAPGADQVARWTEGTPVEVLDCTLAADGQGVWYQLASKGVTGWASARYIDVPGLASSGLGEWDFMIRPAGIE